MMNELLTSTKNYVIEAPHPHTPVEWWFFNGYFESNSSDKRYFMVSFFRHNLAEENEPVETGYSLLFSLLNPETGENITRSQVDQAILNKFIRMLQYEREHELDPDLLYVLSKELQRHGPPLPILLRQSRGELTGQSLEITWEDFTLRQRNTGFELTFPTFENDRKYSLYLQPGSEHIEFKTGNNSDVLKGEMIYRCYPVLQVSGTSGTGVISGKAWMDHQWGDTSWFISSGDQNRLLGWDWFGINLDDGTNIIIAIHKYAKTGEVVYSRTVISREGEQPYVAGGLRTETIEFWESPVTHIKYPVSWKIEISDINLSLTFTPTTYDQEIPVFGLARAIWEGAGNVTGTMDGNKITGRARGEFYGYGYVFDFQNYLKNLADRVDKRIEEFFPKRMTDSVIHRYIGPPNWKNEPEAYTEMLSKPVWDLILRKGKRWRPIFGLLMHEALGKPSTHYERSCCLAELIHSGALIIDDIEDNSDLRRGEPSLHLKYGLDVALNAGNTLYFLPSVELLHHEHLNDMQKLRIHEIMMNTYLQAHFGQTLDIYWSKYMNFENLSKWLEDDIESKILQMYDYKTAAGPKGLAEIAALLTGVDKNITSAAISFARAFAVAFQIIDDVHNFSNSSRWTKVCGEDITNGKLTFAIAKAIKMLEQEKNYRLKQILCDVNYRNNGDTLQEGVELVRASGALEVCKEEAKKMSMDAWEQFADIVPSCEAKIMLNMLCLKMLDLAYDT